jgi:pantetheine-phosphate adenylyltransferase
VKTALYAGSFDPVHHGHVDIIEQAAKCFDAVVVGVMENRQKLSGMFSTSDRVRLLHDTVRNLDNVTVRSFVGLTVHLASLVGADVLVRAAHKDARAESQMAAINLEVGSIPTVFLPPSTDTMAISSSIIRTLTLNGRVDAAEAMVPSCVAEALALVANRRQ